MEIVLWLFQLKLNVVTNVVSSDEFYDDESSWDWKWSFSGFFSCFIKIRFVSHVTRRRRRSREWYFHITNEKVVKSWKSCRFQHFIFGNIFILILTWFDSTKEKIIKKHTFEILNYDLPHWPFPMSFQNISSKQKYPIETNNKLFAHFFSKIVWK